MRNAALALAMIAPLAIGAAPRELAPPDPAPPRRIVSLNPCVDAILREVAPSGRIAAISSYSRDPAATSVPLDWARRHPAILGTAEEVIALRPDLVIASRHTDLATRAALDRAGLRVMLVDVPTSVAESLAQIDAIADAVGARARGAQLRRSIVAALQAARPTDGARPVSALIYQGGGLVPGTGTLADELLRRTGFANASARYRLRMWDVLPIEPLVARPPRVVFSSEGQLRGDGSFGGASATMRGRALAMLGGRVLVRDYPPALLHCAGPTIIAASRTLAAARREVTR